MSSATVGRNVRQNLSQKVLAEALGTALLLAVVIGSGIMAERLSGNHAGKHAGNHAGGNMGVAMLANTLATVGGLYVLIEVFGPISGAHFNPEVSAVMALRAELSAAMCVAYVAAQLLGAMLGAWYAHAMFETPVLQFSTHVRSGLGQWIAEVMATSGLLLMILRAPPGRASGMGQFRLAKKRSHDKGI
jgi:glycerol uptake facilitator-like aquaporin